MKRLLCLLTVISICISVQSAEDRFISSLRNCSAYAESGNMNVNGVDAYSKKQMLGWSDGKCVYKETLNYGGANITTTCRFTKPQIKEIVSVADAYYLTLKYTKEDVDTSSLDGLKNNPLAIVMNKYLQDTSVCNIEGME